MIAKWAAPQAAMRRVKLLKFKLINHQSLTPQCTFVKAQMAVYSKFRKDIQDAGIKLPHGTTLLEVKVQIRFLKEVFDKLEVVEPILENVGAGLNRSKELKTLTKLPNPGKFLITCELEMPDNVGALCDLGSL